MTGEISRLIFDRGFGFIAAEDGKKYFFHTSGLVDVRFDDLVEAQPVVFEPIEGEKGPRALQVRLAEPPAG
jgi:cold shock protein